MKVQIFILFTILILTNYIKAQDISNLLKDRQYVQKQINCILNRGHCDSIGRKIKELLPEAVNNRCQRCTPRQAAHAHTLIAFMQQNYPYEWRLILQHYAAMRHYTN
ncbi:allergen Tha p 1-like [Lasioglossum baleicum]|uniref:allergen Tha p 1-like n=1 Tax=Lasioglossum baleicum TaxID=434251 RepID=UPI003FCD05C3